MPMLFDVLNISMIANISALFLTVCAHGCKIESYVMVNLCCSKVEEPPWGQLCAHMYCTLDCTVVL